MRKLLLMAAIILGVVACQQEDQTILETEVQEIETVNWQDSLIQVDDKESNAGRHGPSPRPVSGLVKLGTQNRRGNFRLIWSEHITDMRIRVMLLDGTFWIGEGYNSRNVYNVRDSHLIERVWFQGNNADGEFIGDEVLLNDKRDELARNSDFYADLGVDNLEDALGDEFYIYYPDTHTYLKFTDNRRILSYQTYPGEGVGGTVERYVSNPYDEQGNYVPGCIEDNADDSYFSQYGVYRIEYGKVEYWLGGAWQPEIEVFTMDEPNGDYPGQYRVPADTNALSYSDTFGNIDPSLEDAEKGVLFLSEADFIDSPTTAYQENRRICTEDPAQGQIDSLAGSTPELAIETSADLTAAINLGLHDSYYLKNTETGDIIEITEQCSYDWIFAVTGGAPAGNARQDLTPAFDGFLRVTWYGQYQFPCGNFKVNVNSLYMPFQDWITYLIERYDVVNFRDPIEVSPVNTIEITSLQEFETYYILNCPRCPPSILGTASDKVGNVYLQDLYAPYPENQANKNLYVDGERVAMIFGTNYSDEYAIAPVGVPVNEENTLVFTSAEDLYNYLLTL